MLLLLSLPLLGHLHRALELCRRDCQVAARGADVGVAEQVADVVQGHARFEPATRGLAPKVVEVQVLDRGPATRRLPRGLDAVQPLANRVRVFASALERSAPRRGVAAFERSAEAEAKLDLKGWIAWHLGWSDLGCDTRPAEKKFNVWVFYDRNRGPRRANTEPVRLRFPLA